MRLRIAEEHRVAALRQHRQADVGERRRAAELGRVQVHDQARHALAAAARQCRRAWVGGIEVVVVRFVFGAGLVVQHLQALAVFRRPVEQLGDAFFDAQVQFALAALEEHAAARARGVDLVLAGLPVDRFRTRHARLRGGDQRFALLGAEQIAEHDHARRSHFDQHLYVTIAGIERQRHLGDVGFGHAFGGLIVGRERNARARIFGEDDGERIARRAALPAGGHQFRNHLIAARARQGAVEDPLLGFGGDGGFAHASSVCFRAPRFNAASVGSCGWPSACRIRQEARRPTCRRS